MKNPNFSIIVLTYNALDYTKKCIESIKNNTKVSYELIIIDNNSIDGTEDWLKAQWESSEIGDNVQIYINDENKGVAGGRNQGIRSSSGDVIVFLDNDTEVGSGWDMQIIENISKSDIGVVGKSGVNIKSLNPVEWQPHSTINSVAYVDVVSGFCFAFKRHLLDLVGMPWENFPNKRFWHEDLEFCKRISLSGYKIIEDRSINIVHHEHKSMGDDKDDIHKDENQFGFNENAKYIATRFKDSNVFTFYRTLRNGNNRGAYDVICDGLSKGLRDIGRVVVRKSDITSKTKSFDLCKCFEIGYQDKRYVTLFQENNVPPKSWRKEMENYDGAFIGSDHLMMACIDEPYFSKLIATSPVGYDSSIYNIDNKGSKFDKFTFLMVGASQPRKNMEFLIDNYCKVFKYNTEVILMIKDGSYGRFNELSRYIEGKKKEDGCPLIVHMTEFMDESQMAKLYRTVANNGVYIHPHRAECFGMPLIEAIACGANVITTRWGGPMTNLMGINTVKYIGFELVDSKFHNWSGEPFYEADEKPLWAEPDAEDLQSLMVEAFNSKYDQTEAKISEQLIKEKFDYKNVADRFNSYFKHYDA